MAKSYFTDFPAPPAPENPISEGGEWVGSDNTNLTAMRTTAGRCIATAAGVGAYDDSATKQTGYADDCEITSGVFLDPTLDPDATHECELLLRVQDSSSVTEQIECLYAFFGGTQCVRWFDNGGAQDFDFLTAVYTGSSFPGQFTTGDVIQARMVGKAIEMVAYAGGLGGTRYDLAVYINTAITTGDPGIGGFTRVADGGDPTKFCFTDAFLSDEFVPVELAEDLFNRANESPLSGGGNWTGVAGMGDLRLVGNEIAVVTPSTESLSRFVGVSAPFDMYSEVDVSVDSPGANDGGPAICVNSSGDMIFAVSYDGANVYLFTRIGGSFNQLIQVAGTWAVGDRLRLWRHGSEIYFTINDVLVAQVEELTVFGGAWGVFMYDGTLRFGGWRGGYLATVPPAPATALEADLQCVSSVTASMSVGKQLQASPACVSTVTANMSNRVALAAALVAASTVTGSMSVGKQLQASPACVSTVTATLSNAVRLQAALVCESTVGADLKLRVPLAAALQCSSSASATMSVGKQLQAALGCDSSVTALLSNRVPLAAALLSESTVSAALSLAGGLRAVLECQSTVTAVLSNRVSLAASLGSVSTVTADLTNAEGDALIAALQSVSTVTAFLSVRVPLAAALQCASSVFADLQTGQRVELPSSVPRAPEGLPVGRNPRLQVLAVGAALRAAEPKGVATARFGFADAYTGLVSNTRSSPEQRRGFVLPVYNRGWNFAYVEGRRLWIRPGLEVTMFSRGEVWVRFGAGANAGDPVYADPVDGALLSGYAQGFELTEWTVLQDAAPGQLTVISTWSKFT